MKTLKEQKSQKVIKPRLDEPFLFSINSPKYCTGIKFNKENDRSQEGIYINKLNKDSNDPFKKSRQLLINSPKGTSSLKTKVLSKANIHLKDQESKEQQVGKNKRKHQFASIKNRINELEDKLTAFRNNCQKKDEKRDKSIISKSRSVEKITLPLKPLQTENVSISPPLKTPSSSPIASFVTQVSQPTQNIQCSSSSALSFVSKLKPTSHKYYVSSIVSAFCDKLKTTFTQLCKTHLMTSLQLFNTLKNSQKPTHVLVQKKLPKTNKKTIIFDLDETLIHCNESVDIPSDEKLNIGFPTGEVVQVGINVRPWARQCLRELSQYYQIMIFTASHECYGNVVADYLDPTGQIIAARYFRDSCYKCAQGFYVKDLRIIDRPLENMLLIDNAAYSYYFQIQNGVPIIPFYNNKNDTELRHLYNFLKDLRKSSNITRDMCNLLKVHEYYKFNDPIELIKTLFAAEMK